MHALYTPPGGAFVLARMFWKKMLTCFMVTPGYLRNSFFSSLDGRWFTNSKNPSMARRAGSKIFEALAAVSVELSPDSSAEEEF
jgi:hypothetical protein